MLVTMSVELLAAGAGLAVYVVTFLLGRELARGFATWRTNRRDRP